jgi:hypothetical protein
MLYNLREDIGERQELSRQRQDIARKLRPMLAAWEADVNKEALANEPDVAALLRQLDRAPEPALLRIGGERGNAPAGSREAAPSPSRGPQN